MFDVKHIRADFPLYETQPDISYLDSAAMSLKPLSVIEAVGRYYREYSANVFRGVYKMSEQATYEYERSRETVAEFINANSAQEVVFLRNTTEAVNLIAYSWGRENIDGNSEIMTTVMEHHSNFVPWQQLAAENGAALKIADMSDTGLLEVEGLIEGIGPQTKLLALTYVSNALGSINPVKEIIIQARKRNPDLLVLIDGAQAIPHMKVDVRDLDCDFFVCSGQKMLGPTGAGFLWARKAILDDMPPFLYGGEMISEVHLDNTSFAQAPHKFEAGTPHIAGVIGLREAILYLAKLGMDNIRQHEKELLEYGLERIGRIENVNILGTHESAKRSGVLTFTMDGVHAHDIAQVLDEGGVCVRSGHHCAMPLHERLKVDASVRASFYLYNTKADIDRLTEGMVKASGILRLKK